MQYLVSQVKHAALIIGGFFVVLFGAAGSATDSLDVGGVAYADAPSCTSCGESCTSCTGDGGSDSGCGSDSGGGSSGSGGCGM